MPCKKYSYKYIKMANKNNNTRPISFYTAKKYRHQNMNAQFM